MFLINIKSIKRCAFCKYWYDPTNEYITPKTPKVNLWEFDNSAKCMCMQRNVKIAAGNAACQKYECKIPII